MSSIENLASLFMKFPGIGTRQAKRFVYFLLNQDPRFLDKLAREIAELRSTIHQCPSCFRFHPDNTQGFVCSLCNEADPQTILVIEKDTDLETIHKSGSYKGMYFVLGGTIPVVDQTHSSRIRINELLKKIEQSAPQGLSEIILALSANPEGDHTRDYIIQALAPLANNHHIAITALGRGLSTGSELEYSDGETLKHAFKNRG